MTGNPEKRKEVGQLVKEYKKSEQQAKKQQARDQPATDQDLVNFSEGDDDSDKKREAELSQSNQRGGGGSFTVIFGRMSRGLDGAFCPTSPFLNAVNRFEEVPDFSFPILSVHILIMMVEIFDSGHLASTFFFQPTVADYIWAVTSISG